jgi:hypothetical protein
VLLRVFALWTIYVWLVLIWNIWHDHTKGQTGIGFKSVHFVLAAISLTLAVGAWRVVTAVAGKRAIFRRQSGAASDDAREKSSLSR